MKKTATIFFLLLLTLRLSAQHNAMYSQYMFNGLLINPAYTGSNDVLNITLLNRTQWTSFDGAPRTSVFTAHTPLRNKKINLGIAVIDDRLGVTHQDKLSLFYAYRLRLGKGALFMGVQGGALLIHNNWGQIITTTPGDQVFTGQSEQKVLPQAGFGIYYRSDKLYAGVASPDLYSGVSISNVFATPWLLTTGYVFHPSENIHLKPSLLVKYIAHSPTEVDLNMNAYYKSTGLGVSYRSYDALVFLIDFRFNEQLIAGYAYDLTLTRLGAYNNGSHEVMLRYEFGYSVKAKNPRYF
jgi:type IX secretion system PorP/SprF family membrane protein